VTGSTLLEISKRLRDAKGSTDLLKDAIAAMGSEADSVLPAMLTNLEDLAKQADSIQISDKSLQNIRELKDAYADLKSTVLSLLTPLARVWEMDLKPRLANVKAVGAGVSGFFGAKGGIGERLKGGMEAAKEAYVDTHASGKRRQEREDQQRQAGIALDALKQEIAANVEILKLREKIASTRDKAYLESLDNASKLVELERRRADLRKQSVGSEKERLELQLKELDIDSQIARLRKEKSKAASSSALGINQLQRIGAFTSGTQGVDRQILNTAQVQERHLGKAVQALHGQTKQLAELIAVSKSKSQNRGVQF
jgi:hypothetical protein